MPSLSTAPLTFFGPVSSVECQRSLIACLCWWRRDYRRKREAPMANHDSNPEVAAAKAIATIAHRFQTDKIGVPYIEHPRRVATRLVGPKYVAAAWLHDVIEDCGITAENLAAAGISDEVIAAVVLLTRTKDNGGNGYYEAI